MLETWVITLEDVTSTGNLTQLYPSWVSAGAVPPGSPSAEIRMPTQGFLRAAQVKTDGSNGGYVEIWDINGLDAGADVSSLTVITNAQLVAMQAAGLAKCLWNQNFTATSGASTPSIFGKQVMRGLAARFVGAAGEITLNLDVEGGYRKIATAG